MMGLAPLPHEYMITGIIGFFVSIFMITNLTWSFTFGLFSLLLVIASLVSLNDTDLDEDTLNIVRGRK